MPARDTSRPEVVDGRIDIHRSLEPVELRGKWAFFSGTFVSPSSGSASGSVAGRFETFPASWTSYGPESIPAKGIATYSVTITGLDAGELYAFRFPGYSSACEFYVNGARLFSEGRPAENEKDEIPAWDSMVVQMPGTGVSEVHLVMHISNFHDIFPASWAPVLIGSYEKLSAEHSHSRLGLIIPFAAILAMGAFFVSLFVFRRDDSSCLWLGVLGLVFALRIICYDQYIIQDLFPFVSTDLMFRLGFLSFSLAVVCFIGFIRSMYPEYALRPVVLGVYAVAGLYALINMVAPTWLSLVLLPTFQKFTVIGSGFVIYVIARALISRKPGAILFLSGFIGFFAMIVRDILISNRVIDGMFMSHFGVVLIMGFMSLILVERFAMAFNSVEGATDDLEKMNVSLKRFVPNEFLKSLGKNPITEIYLGDHIRRDMCVMFVYLGVDMSLRGSSNRHVMLEVFNSILIQVNPVIQKYNGFIDKYLLDGLMVLFPDEPGNTVLCALEIGAAVDAFNGKRNQSLLPEVKYAAGIHCGSLMLGTIGDVERMDSTVISDVVNISCRLRQFALDKGVRIVISGAVSEFIGGEETTLCGLLSHGDVLLKGKDKPVRIFEVRES